MKKDLSIDINIRLFVYNEFGTERQLIEERDFHHFIPHEKYTCHFLDAINNLAYEDRKAFDINSRPKKLYGFETMYSISEL